MSLPLIKNESIDFAKLRRDFPILQSKNRGKPLIYLDSAASAQKPSVVIEAMNRFYQHEYANIHRGIYELSEQATKRYEAIRVKIKQFINAPCESNVVFTSGTTASINLLAQSLSRMGFKAGDEVILSEMEHHANIVPWYFLQKEIGIVLKIVPILADGSLDIDAFKKLISPRVKLIALAHVANATGIINPVKQITSFAHAYDIPVLIDGAQAIPHLPVDVKDIDCDFYVFSSHKLYGPTGLGILYAKSKWLDKMPPYQGGGGMIESVSFSEITFAKGPEKFEAGTPAIASVIGLGKAIDYLTAIGMDQIFQHEQDLLHYTLQKFAEEKECRMIGDAQNKIGIISFVMPSIHAHDLGTILDHEGIAVRAGHHCAMPLMKRFNVPATLRVSLGLYNNEQDIDALFAAIHVAKRLFS